MDERPKKEGGWGNIYLKERPNKKLVSRQNNGKKFLETEKRTISYCGYTFRYWQLLSRDLHSNIADWRKELGYKGNPKKISSGSTNRGYANKRKVSALKVKISKISKKVAAILDKEESDPDKKNPSNLIKKTCRWNYGGDGTYIPVNSGSTCAINRISRRETAHLCGLMSGTRTWEAETHIVCATSNNIAEHLIEEGSLEDDSHADTCMIGKGFYIT